MPPSYRLLTTIVFVLSTFSLHMLEGQSTTVNYLTNNTDFPNPERGFYYPTNSDSGLLNSASITALRTPYTPWQATYQVHSTLVFRYYMLTPYVNSAIPSSYLQNMETDFNAIRTGGAKVILRFSYTNTLVGPPYGDASKAQVLDHIQQLASVLSDHADVIAAVQLGFIGTWGEGYYTDHFGDASTAGSLSAADWDDRAEVIAALLAALPANRMIQVRYPQQKQKYEFGNAAPTTSPATGGRIGFHNDCFLATNTDAGTFVNYDPWSAAHATMTTDLRAYKADDSQAVVVGGETCADNTDVLGDEACAIDGGRADTDLALFHYSYLNSDYNNAAVNNQWVGSCMDDIKRKLGYRFAITSGTFTNEAQPGQLVNISLDLENEGYAAPFNPRGIEYILRHTVSGDLYYASPSTDPQQWMPGAAVQLNQSFCLPADIPIGNYELLLHLPDPEPSLYGNPHYSIRLAYLLPGSIDPWESSTGFNNLGHTLEVNNTASEPACDGSTSFGTVSALPVDWLSFRAIAKAKREVELRWETAQEDNNRGFSIERSTDGKVFQEIGWVDSRGSGGGRYQSIDLAPDYAQLFFYRLRQVDWDGRSSYSTTVNVRLQDGEDLVQLFPNPGSAPIYVSAGSDLQATLFLYDGSGREVWRAIHDFRNGEIELPTDLSAGVYFLQVLAGHRFQRLKVVIH